MISGLADGIRDHRDDPSSEKKNDIKKNDELKESQTTAKSYLMLIYDALEECVKISFKRSTLPNRKIKICSSSLSCKETKPKRSEEKAGKSTAVTRKWTRFGQAGVRCRFCSIEHNTGDKLLAKNSKLLATGHGRQIRCSPYIIFFRQCSPETANALRGSRDIYSQSQLSKPIIKSTPKTRLKARNRSALCTS